MGEEGSDLQTLGCNEGHSEASFLGENQWKGIPGSIEVEDAFQNWGSYQVSEDTLEEPSPDDIPTKEAFS